MRTHATRVAHMTGGHAARAVSRAGLSRGRPFPPDQQDAGRDLSRAGPLRDDVRARAAGRRHRASARHRSDRSAPAQRRSRSTKCRITRPLEALGEEIHFDSGDYAGLLDKLARPRRLGRSSTPSSRARRAAGELVGVGLRHVRREERARPGRWRAHRGRHLGRWSRSSPAAPRSARASRP